MFALAAWFVARSGSARPGLASIAVIGGATLLGAILEPAWEYWFGGASFDWTFGPTRTMAAVAFLTAGVIAYAVTFRLVRMRRAAKVGSFAG